MIMKRLISKRILILSPILAITFFLLVSCNNHCNKESPYVLIFSPENSNVIKKSLLFDSIFINNYDNDSVLISKYSNGKPINAIFFNNNGNLCEKRYRCNDLGEFLGIDSILTFSKKHYTFSYKSERIFIPIVWQYSFADCLYSIDKIGNEYITTKQSLVDTSYKEIFYYDEDYNIYKFINTWNNNKCVYIKR